MVQYEEPVLDDPMFCPNICGRSYRGKNRKGNLKRHLSFECEVMSLFKYRCDICLKIYTRKETLTTHRVNSHNVFWVVKKIDFRMPLTHPSSLATIICFKVTVSVQKHIFPLTFFLLFVNFTSSSWWWTRDVVSVSSNVDYNKSWSPLTIHKHIIYRRFHFNSMYITLLLTTSLCNTN